MNELTDELHGSFLDLACRLSPENLTCDGELGRLNSPQVRAKAKRLLAEWKKLEKRAGREVSEDEIWARQIKKVMGNK